MKSSIRKSKLIATKVKVSCYNINRYANDYYSTAGSECVRFKYTTTHYHVISFHTSQPMVQTNKNEQEEQQNEDLRLLAPYLIDDEQASWLR